MNRAVYWRLPFDIDPRYDQVLQLTTVFAIMFRYVNQKFTNQYHNYEIWAGAI